MRDLAASCLMQMRRARSTLVSVGSLHDTGQDGVAIGAFRNGWRGLREGRMEMKTGPGACDEPRGTELRWTYSEADRAGPPEEGKV
jgi:hypothetical protein